MIWNVIPETVSGSKEHPATCGFAIGVGDREQPGAESYPYQWHVLLALRDGGGNDVRVPRRCVGIGPTRASARRSLTRAISRYDSSYRLVFPSERASDEDA